VSVRVGTLRQRLLAGALVCAAAMTAAPVRAQQREQPRVDTTVVKVHVVKRGDTLWDLSNTYLGSPWIWQRIYERNRSLIKNPHWIYPGQKFDIPALIRAAAALEAEDALADSAAQHSRFYRRLAAVDTSSGGPDDRAWPVVERSEYMATPWLEDAASLPVVGLMLDRVRVESQAERLAQLAILQDRIYIRAEGNAGPPAVGAEMLLVRVERWLAPYGNVIEPTAMLRVERSGNGVAVASVIKQFGLVLKGQRALPVPAFRAPAASPAQLVERGPEGTLVAFLRDHPLHTTADVGFVSLGSAEGLQLGDELMAFAPARPSPTEAGTELPPEDVARLLVMKVGEHSATVRVLTMRQPSLRSGLKVRLVARVP